jgi:hypothetical protein
MQGEAQALRFFVEVHGDRIQRNASIGIRASEHRTHLEGKL